MANDKFDLDDLDSILDSLDDSQPSEPKTPKELGTRKVIESIALGAKDSITEKNTVSKHAGIIAKNALPEGYSSALGAADQGAAFFMDLYNGSMKQLEKPLKDLRKAIAKKADSLPDLVDGKIKDLLKSWSPDEETIPEAKGAYSADRLLIDSTLKSVFGAQRALVEQNALSGERAAAVEAKADLFNSSSLESTRLVLDQVSRLVGYNDTVNFKWQQKSLELQHLQYFAQRDLLRIFTGHSRDVDAQLASIVHNTALPEAVKIQTTEGFMQSQKQRLYGNVGDTIEEYQDKFLGKTKENIRKKIDGFVQDLATNMGTITDIISSDGLDLGDMSLEEKLRLGGSLAGDVLQSTVGVKLSKGIGNKLRKYIERSPSLKTKSNELMYLFENFPSIFNEELRNWDGKVLPQSILDKVPALGALDASFIKDGLRDIIPRNTVKGLQIDQPKLDELAAPVTWSELERRSLVDIIPSFLSRQLQELEQIRTGQSAERQMYSFEEGGIVRESEAKQQLQKTIFGDDTRSRNRYADALVRLLGVGSGVELSPEADEALRAVLLGQSQKGKAFNIESLKEMDYGDEAVTSEILSMINQSKGNLSQRNLSGARIQKELAKGQRENQQMLNFAVNSGQLDVLKSMGLVGRNKYGDLKVDQATAARMAYGNESPDAYTVAESFVAQRPTVASGGNSDLSQFMVDMNGVSSLPVHISTRTQDAELELLETTRSGFSDQIQLLDAILGGILRMEAGVGGGEGSADGSMPKRKRGIGGIIESTLSGMGNFTRGWYGGIADFTTAGAGAIGTILGSVTGRRKPGDSDVYVAGRKEPAIRANLLKKGFYRNKETGKPIFSIDEIDGEIVDANGNVVITQSDVDDGIYLATGENITELFNKGLGFVKDKLLNTIGFQNMLVSKLMSLPKAGYDAITKRVRDIYVRGETRPRLQALLLKNGSYFSAVTGKPIYKAEDIDGEVLDAAGNVIISNDDLVTGLVDNIGTPIGGNRLVQLAKNITTTGMDLASRLAAFSIDQGNRIVSGTYDFMSGIKDMVMGGITINKMGYGEGGGSDVITKIYDHMRRRWPLEGESVYSDMNLDADRDDDGIRDNSWQDILSRSEDSAAEPTAAVDTEEKEEKSSGGLLSFIMPLIGSITSGFGGLMEALKGIGTTIATWFAFNKASATGEAASDILGDLTGAAGDGPGRKTPGKKGFMSKILGGAKNLVGKGLNLVRGAAPVAMAAAKWGGKKLLTTGAAAIAGVAGAPVIAAAITVGGLAYAGYEVYSYFSKRSKPKELERLRFLMYGINPEDMDDVVKIREMESDAIDEVSFTSRGPTFALSVGDAVSRYAKIFGVDMESSYDLQRWGEWFTRRFFPVFMVNLNLSKGIDKSIDLLEIDSALDKERKAEFATALASPANYTGGKLPWNNTMSPYPGKGSPVMPSDISIAIHNIASMGKGDEKYEGEFNTAPSENSSETTRPATDYMKAKSPVTQYGANTAPKPSSYSSTGQLAAKGGLDSAIVGASAKATGGSIRMIMPCEGRISSPYGMRVHPITGARKMHNGVDIAAPKGTPIVAAADGIIYRLYISKSYGKVIYLKHENGMASRYAHMDNFAVGLAMGDRVKQGQVIGYVGNTGASAGDHLHWEVRVTSAQWADTIDPLTLVGGNVKSDLAKEEKAIVKDEIAAEKESSDTTLEGQDTLRSTLIPKSVEDNKPLDTAPSTNATPNPVMEKERAQAQATATAKESAKALDVQMGALEKAYAQREVMIANQTASLEKLDAIHQALVDMPGYLSSVSKPTSATKRPATNRVNGVVKMTD